MRYIAIFSNSIASGYSGGRYHSWILAEALADQGCKVDYFTDFFPLMSVDFEGYPNHQKINVIISEDFEKAKPSKKYDYVFLIPNQSRRSYFYRSIQLFSIEAKAKLVFLNFESGNWYEKVSPFKKSFNHWRNWQKACSVGAIVLSSNQESENYAVEFYNKFSSNVRYINSWPAVNDMQIASVNASVPQKRNHIVFFVRLSDKHKGSEDIQHFFDKRFEGYTFKFIIGSNVLPSVRIFYTKLGNKFNIRVKFMFQLDDLSKFEEIAESKLLVFPSYFEGFGYPPVEARSLNTQTVCYHLPVLAEVSADNLHYVEPMNYSLLTSTSLEVLTNDKFMKHLKPYEQTISSYGSEVLRLLEKNADFKHTEGLEILKVKVYVHLYRFITPIIPILRFPLRNIRRILRR